MTESTSGATASAHGAAAGGSSFGDRDGVIRDLRVYRSPMSFDTNFGNHMARFVWERVVIRLELESGVEGWALPVSIRNEGASLAEFLLRVLKPVLIGEDVRAPEKIWQRMDFVLRRERPRHGLGAIDIAVWDAAGRLAGVPVWQLLGGGRPRARAYASTPTLASPADYREFAQQCVSEGFTAVKLHAFGDPVKDIEACEVARDAVGPDVDLMLDVVGAYFRDRRAAVDVGKALERLDFHWYEHPLRDDDIEGFREVRRKLDIPIAGPDGLRDLIDHRNFLLAEATDYVRPNAEFHCGLTGQRKVAHMAECMRLGCEPHTYGTPLHQMANLHGICAMPQPAFLEIPVPLGIVDGLTDSVIRPESDGWVTVPEEPGLGMTIDQVQLEELATEVTA